MNTLTQNTGYLFGLGNSYLLRYKKVFIFMWIFCYGCRRQGFASSWIMTWSGSGSNRSNLSGQPWIQRILKTNSGSRLETLAVGKGLKLHKLAKIKENCQTWAQNQRKNLPNEQVYFFLLMIFIPALGFPKANSTVQILTALPRILFKKKNKIQRSKELWEELKSYGTPFSPKLLFII